MKLYGFLILGVMIFSTACGGSSKSEKSVKSKEVGDKETQKDLVKIYKEYVADLDSNDVKSVGSAMNMYKQLFKDASEEECDTAFLAFHHLYTGMTDILNEDVMNNVALQETVWLAYDENGKKLPMPKAYIMEEKKVKPYGYRLEFPEGMISIGYDRSYIAKHFYDFVSPTMKSYLERLDKDNENTFAEDGGIMISEKEYVERLIWYENFEKKNPDFLLIDEVKETRRYLFAFFLTGMDNTPVYLEEEIWPVQFAITDYFKNAYTLLQQKYPDSETWKRTKTYKQALLEADRIKMAKLIDDYTKKGWVMDFEKGY
jgi:hypothetical protein